LVACKAIDLLFHKRSFPNEIHFGVEYVIFFQLSIYELILNIFVGASGNIFILIYKIICTITFYLVYFVFLEFRALETTFMENCTLGYSDILYRSFSDQE
jgi:hypothetical protein